jgi:hypothetical protein
VLRNDPTIAEKLLGYAYKKTSDISRAKDAAQEAVARMLEGKGFCRWDPGGKTLLNHLADIVDTVVANENRRAAARARALKTSRRARRRSSSFGASQHIVYTTCLRASRALPTFWPPVRPGRNKQRLAAAVKRVSGDRPSLGSLALIGPAFVTIMGAAGRRGPGLRPSPGLRGVRP